MFRNQINRVCSSEMCNYKERYDKMDVLKQNRSKCKEQKWKDKVKLIMSWDSIAAGSPLPL